ncbi:inosine-uridine preferring nucleoside hydrolase [Trichoderma harzianum]|uniref:Inosine-uridine preferring nucleoside hydrolase n=1 Tax=Trichoderma harzianum TaxID=5544 RepID=A0A0F9XCZ7_TRIHA|nr:inosine-uridine preferring nucleoside hydrolase [Trichoderma harzianum]
MGCSSIHPNVCCLRNALALFHVIEKEIEWRKSTGRPEGFEVMKSHKPIVALGADRPLQDEIATAEHIHSADGADGLHNVHNTYSHLAPSDAWNDLFNGDADDSVNSATYSPFFTASKVPAYKEMLRILKENLPDTISILVMGPLTNVALAAAEDPETFLKVKEVVVMGGAINVPGNVTPVAEFNTYADRVAAARLYALTLLVPASTMPPASENFANLPAYPAKLSRRLKLTLLPLDITTRQTISRSVLNERIKPFINAGSPLALWIAHCLNGAIDGVANLVGDDVETGFSLPDVCTVWYAMMPNDPAWEIPDMPADISIETAGQWTKGMHMHIIDSRNRSRQDQAVLADSESKPVDESNFITVEEGPGDPMGWLSHTRGNRLNRITSSPAGGVFDIWMEKVLEG